MGTSPEETGGIASRLKLKLKLMYKRKRPLYYKVKGIALSLKIARIPQSAEARPVPVVSVSDSLPTHQEEGTSGTLKRLPP